MLFCYQIQVEFNKLSLGLTAAKVSLKSVTITADTDVDFFGGERISPATCNANVRNFLCNPVETFPANVHSL